MTFQSFLFLIQIHLFAPAPTPTTETYPTMKQSSVSDFHTFGYDCMDSQFIRNLSISDLIDPEKDLDIEEEPVDVQFIQKVSDDQVYLILQ